MKYNMCVTGICAVLYCVVFCMSAISADASPGNISPSARYAWSENGGWVNFRPNNGGVRVLDGWLTGYAWAEGVGWVKLGSAAGGPYANTTNANWGVNRSGTVLSGFAWSDTSGWIKFNPVNGGVAVDPASGAITGWAWGEGIGWVHFSSPGPVYSMAYIPGTYGLNLGFAGTGEGSVNDGVIYCGSGCTFRAIPYDDIVLTADPDQYSLLGPWIGACTGSSPICTVTMDVDAKSVTAAFNIDSAHSVLVGSTAYFSSINSAYVDAATVNGTVIKVWGVDLGEQLLLAQSKSVKLQGGFNATYSGNTGGVTTVRGPMRVRSGLVRVENLKVK